MAKIEAWRSLQRPNSANTNSFPPNTQFQVNASCQDNEQLMGGGYTIQNTNSTDPHLAVEGNYPSASNTWTVKVRNPDNPPLSTNDADESIIVSAYCLTNQNYPLDMEIASTPPTSIPKQFGGGTLTKCGGALFKAECDCAKWRFRNNITSGILRTGRGTPC